MTEMMQQTTVILPNGQKGTLGSPAHLLLRRMAATVTGYAACGKGGDASVTQLRALARDHHAKLHHAREGARLRIVGAYLTPAGERYVEMLDAEARRLGLIEDIAAAFR